MLAGEPVMVPHPDDVEAVREALAAGQSVPVP
jgi:hypothetical protein